MFISICGKESMIMKKWLALLAVAMMLVPLCAFAADEIIINKIQNPENDFAFPEDAKLLEIYFPKIYDSAGAFIRYGEYTMLFDTAGGQWDQTKKLLDSLGVTELTYACNSHPHSDHVYGFQYIFKDIPAGEFIRFFEDDFLDANKTALREYEALRAMGVPFRHLQPGDIIPFGDVKIRVLQAIDPKFSGNNQSALLMVELGERRFLFASDIQMDGQLRLLDNNEDVKADILQHPHHGYNRMQHRFLMAVDPELVIVTSLAASANGVDYLEQMNVAYHYTNLGVMKMTTDGSVWVIERIK